MDFSSVNHYVSSVFQRVLLAIAKQAAYIWPRRNPVDCQPIILEELCEPLVNEDVLIIQVNTSYPSRLYQVIEGLASFFKPPTM